MIWYLALRPTGIGLWIQFISWFTGSDCMSERFSGDSSDGTDLSRFLQCPIQCLTMICHQTPEACSAAVQCDVHVVISGRTIAFDVIIQQLTRTGIH